MIENKEILGNKIVKTLETKPEWFEYNGITLSLTVTNTEETEDSALKIYDSFIKLNNNVIQFNSDIQTKILLMRNALVNQIKASQLQNDIDIFLNLL
jgi:hypothetical protein